MAKSTISIRIDENLKKETEATLENMGLNLTTAVTIFAKTLVKEQKFPFEITADPFYSAENQAYLKKAIAALESKQGETHELIND